MSAIYLCTNGDCREVVEYAHLTRVLLCDACRAIPRCSRERCKQRAVRSDLCERHAGEGVKFLGRWRSLADACARVMSDPAMRGVTWEQRTQTRGRHVAGVDEKGARVSCGLEVVSRRVWVGTRGGFAITLFASDWEVVP